MLMKMNLFHSMVSFFITCSVQLQKLYFKPII